MAESKIKAKMFVKSFSTGSITESAKGKQVTIDASLAGYTPIAIAGWNCNQATVHFPRIMLNGTDVDLYLYRNDANLSNTSATIYVLYI